MLAVARNHFELALGITKLLEVHDLSKWKT